MFEKIIKDKRRRSDHLERQIDKVKDPEMKLALENRNKKLREEISKFGNYGDF